MQELTQDQLSKANAKCPDGFDILKSSCIMRCEDRHPEFMWSIKHNDFIPAIMHYGCGVGEHIVIRGK